jgi:hypothetical protein
LALLRIYAAVSACFTCVSHTLLLRFYCALLRFVAEFSAKSSTAFNQRLAKCSEKHQVNTLYSSTAVSAIEKQHISSAFFEGIFLRLFGYCSKVQSLVPRPMG